MDKRIASKWLRQLTLSLYNNRDHRKVSPLGQVCRIFQYGPFPSINSTHCLLCIKGIATCETKATQLLVSSQRSKRTHGLCKGSLFQLILKELSSAGHVLSLSLLSPSSSLSFILRLPANEISYEEKQTMSQGPLLAASTSSAQAPPPAVPAKAPAEPRRVKFNVGSCVSLASDV